MTAVQRREPHSSFADLFDWIEEGIPPLANWPMMGIRGGIRVEEREQEGKYVLRAELPGIDPDKDVDITISGDTLAIHAERREEKKEAGRSEFRYGSFSRRLTLPAGANEDDVRAAYHDGILEITVGLAKQSAEPKHVPIARERKE